MKRGNKRKFGREHDQRVALMKSLATALIEHGRIKTTQAKARSLSILMDQLITHARSASLASKRFLSKKLDSKAVQKLAGDIALKAQERSGGYTRITRLGQRLSDGAPMALIEFTASAK